jgi:hypothetical protein
VDGYFAKQDFVLPILKETNLEIISKLRTDADLRYLYEGQPTGRKGRPKEYEGKADVKHIDKTRFSFCYEEGNAKESTKVYQCILYSTTLKRKMTLASI